ncbi:alpha/beta hydrolase [Puniceicoccus vermicola]|uniref:Acetylxylan esterase n=1 Tax=Puniceicoccus vermicola TaxID=388746 RepID=A0A7X1E5P3_9BACT|nr:acetylxylan esterase [Puniceicoccus vermicola]MBC2603860.1 acetylxylan esterase [Puniceicoccus vermicola]
MKSRTRIVSLFCLLWTTHCVVSGDEQQTGLMWEREFLYEAPEVFEAPEEFLESAEFDDLPDGVRALRFEGLPWRGEETRVFAFLGIPEEASERHPVPGVVLIHGAGGTAFARWVKRWMDRGYAAIALDLDGGIPLGTYSHWKRNPSGGPRRGDVQQLGWPLEDQWMYQAVGDTILAHSLISSFPEVDSARIGATGISWGGVVLSNVAGVDPRLKFAVPVYGCGFIADDFDDGSSFVGRSATASQREEWTRLWDPMNRLPDAEMPMLWIAGVNDFAFTPRVRKLSYELAPGTVAVSLRLQMGHSQGRGEAPAEVYAFADNIVKEGKPLPQFLRQGVEEDVGWAEFEFEVSLKRAELCYTLDNGKWQDRVWQSVPAEVDLKTGRVSAPIPPEATVYYFNVTDERGLVVSSVHVEP